MVARASSCVAGCSGRAGHPSMWTVVIVDRRVFTGGGEHFLLLSGTIIEKYQLTLESFFKKQSHL